MSSATEKDAVASGQEYVKTLTQRFDFGSYGQTRKFLDDLADLSKRENYYPDVSFGKIYANISIDSEGQTSLRESNSSFIVDMQVLATQAAE